MINEIFTLYKVRVKLIRERRNTHIVPAAFSLVRVCILVMGHCQGVISHPVIVIFSWTASTTVASIYCISRSINFRGALILCKMKFRKNSLCFNVLPRNRCNMWHPSNWRETHRACQDYLHYKYKIYIKLIHISCLLFISIYFITWLSCNSQYQAVHQTAIPAEELTLDLSSHFSSLSQQR